MTNYAQIWLIFANCGRICGQRWPDLWPNEIVGMAMAIVAIPDITSMISNLFMWTNFVKVLLKHPFQILLMPVTSPLVGAHKFQSLGRLHFTDKKYFLRMLRRAQKHWRAAHCSRPIFVLHRLRLRWYAPFICILFGLHSVSDFQTLHVPAWCQWINNGA